MKKKLIIFFITTILIILALTLIAYVPLKTNYYVNNKGYEHAEDNKGVIIKTNEDLELSLFVKPNPFKTIVSINDLDNPDPEYLSLQYQKSLFDETYYVFGPSPPFCEINPSTLTLTNTSEQCLNYENKLKESSDDIQRMINFLEKELL